MKKLIFTLFLSCWIIPQTYAQQVLTIMTHNSFNISKELINSFEKKNNVTVRFLKGNDGGSMLIQAILSKDNPMADVLFGVDNTFFSRAIKAELFEPYESPLLRFIPRELKLDPLNRLLPVNYGDVCLNYDKLWFEKRSLSPPAGVKDLTLPQYRGLTVVENPATSSPGLAFLLTTIGYFGDGDVGYLQFWKNLKENNVLIAEGWSDAYYNHFTAASKGDRPIVVSYASSPAASVYFSKNKNGPALTAAITQEGSVFRQIEFIGILKGTKQKILAKKFIDFMLSRAVQEDIPLQMFVFPANITATLPSVFLQHADPINYSTTVTPAAIEENREKWLEEWSNVMLR